MSWFKYFLTVLISLSMFQNIALADPEESSVGNGGTARVCTSKIDESQTIELIDYWEARKVDKSFIVDLGPGDFVEKVHYVLDRLAKFDPLRAERLRKKVDKIILNLESYMEDDLLEIPVDAVTNYEPDYEDDEIKCEAKAFAIRPRKIRGDQTPFLFVPKTWNTGVGDNREIARAGILLHEVIGEDSILRLQDFYRDNTRFFNAGISSTDFNDFTAEDYHQLLEETEKISKHSTVFVKARHYLSTNLELENDLVLMGTRIPEAYAKIINLDFHKNRILRTDQELNFGEITLFLPEGTQIEDLNSLLDPTDSLVFEARERRIENIRQVKISNDEKVTLTGSIYNPLKSIKVQEHEVFAPYTFHKNGALAEVKLDSQKYPAQHLEFSTAHGETMRIYTNLESKNLSFNEEELLLHYEPSKYPNNYSFRIKTNAEIPIKNLENTDTFVRLELGYVAVNRKNKISSEEDTTEIMAFDVGSIDRYNSKRTWLHFYNEQFDGKQNYSFLTGAAYFSETDIPKLYGWQFGANYSLVESETNDHLGFKAIDGLIFGPSVRLRPANNSRLKIDIDARGSFMGRAYLSDTDLSRLSPEWKARGEVLNGGPIEEDDLHSLREGGRDMQTWMLDLNVCYTSLDGDFVCNIGGKYRWDRLGTDSSRDDLSPYREQFDRKLHGWDAYVKMKYYFDKKSHAGDAHNYFFLNWEAQHSPLGSHIQTLFDPGQIDSVLNERSSITGGLGWEW